LQAKLKGKKEEARLQDAQDKKKIKEFILSILPSC